MIRIEFPRLTILTCGILGPWPTSASWLLHAVNVTDLQQLKLSEQSGNNQVSAPEAGPWPADDDIMVSVAAMARSHDRVSCYHLHGQYSHHLGGNVGVRVTLRVAIMFTTGEWSVRSG